MFQFKFSPDEASRLSAQEFAQELFGRASPVYFTDNNVDPRLSVSMHCVNKLLYCKNRKYNIVFNHCLFLFGGYRFECRIYSDFYKNA